jgi:Lon-like LonC helical domain
MTKPEPLAADMLYRQCDPQQLSFETTAEIEDLTDAIGQPRAEEAVRFGIGIQQHGYNLFSLGPEGMGKQTIVRRFLVQKAATQPPPPDWCYVNNFDEPQKPRALRLPVGTGSQFRQDVRQLVEELRASIPAAFETDEYRARRQVIEQEVKDKQQEAFEQARASARAKAHRRNPSRVLDWTFCIVPAHTGPIDRAFPDLCCRK